jgi:glycosyltransferase involved in cell wall biosynthesis
MKMKSRNSGDIKLVITIALKKEVPRDWFAACGIPVHTLDAVRAGALKQEAGASSGILILITGAGLEASEEAACWVRDNPNPLFVVNIGTCGIIKRACSPGDWIRPLHVAAEDGSRITLDARFPLPLPELVTHADSLLSVKKASLGSIPNAWQGHDAIDMECYPQAKIFSDAMINFHCLKFGTDYSDRNALSDFQRNVKFFTEQIKKLFSLAETGRNQPGITVVVPVHNRQQTIGRAIDSILSQSRMPEEIIIVDDCSTDNTGDILKSYDEHITPVFLPVNSGPSRARNEGVKRAGTEWVAFLDSDDCWQRDKLKDQAAYLGKYPFYQILQSEEIWIRNGIRVNPCRHHTKPEGWIWEQSLQRCLVSPSGVLVRKALLEQYGMFDEDLPVCEDYDLWLKISRHHPVGLEPGFSVIKYGGHKDQLSRRYPAMDRFRVKSLIRLLEHEPHPDFRRKIINVLEKKLKILINGYEKREKREDAEECRGMLESLG